MARTGEARFAPPANPPRRGAHCPRGGKRPPFPSDACLGHEAAIRALLNATDPDLSAFRQRGGRITMYHGWADAALTPLMSIDLYERALAANRPDTPGFFRFYMVPGMFHCRGGYSTDSFDGMSALVEWVENGTAPDSIPAARVEGGRVTRTRPLCPYPALATHDGQGSPDEAASFACRPPG
ncbi:tannase/feruloyl esterase family alpha/beta hydrolase [Muricoccus pecuniae]|uniref:Tannase/feruloyl esterase family alpha/beta hydrolase n=1 Tax=Muricoccus pecuniae TaxID=693023 RepID=A0A840YK27_9PROT|nr:tannase/feruloyl esterase family alpha/beta hydrolase [Roseomonas pecuniae]MBB5694693.1 hypothetical protein [Roseomonas pecuniae]